MSLPDPLPPAGLPGPVRIVGTGLLGTSLGLALRRRGVDVELADPSPTAVALAMDLGAGVRAPLGAPVGARGRRCSARRRRGRRRP